MRALRQTTVLPILCVLLLAACASKPPKPDVDFKLDYDFGQIRTVALYEHSGEVTGDNPHQISDMQHERVDRALQLALEAKGLQFIEDASQADVLLSWHLVTQFKTDVRSYSTPAYGYHPYGRYNRYSMYNCWDCYARDTNISVRDYTQGTFIIDIIDPALKQSVWRGMIQSRLKDRMDADQATYNAAAARILAAFPPP